MGELDFGESLPEIIFIKGCYLVASSKVLDAIDYNPGAAPYFKAMSLGYKIDYIGWFSFLQNT